AGFGCSFGNSSSQKSSAGGGAGTGAARPRDAVGGTRNGCLHVGHRTVLPANSGPALKRAPHLHETI
ncbi:MAG: hypothetical protein JJ992_25195, partial [Planctomycetes bacterium]|nr:hypothetical protein [Planctomycetota bacterium]